MLVIRLGVLPANKGISFHILAADNNWSFNLTGNFSLSQIEVTSLSDKRINNKQ
jgi:hypothetical protein